ncbi:MAG TPA: TetR/AcrR family transcriptional regulator [Candidatus Elarobacter sp.]|jgi:AcrR family transcriptional regulator
MGIVQRKERQRAELREQILAAARKLVLSEGFEGLTMRKIADAIEYSPATLYLYFENREAIGRQLCEEAFGHLLRYMGTAAQVADPLERLFAIGRGYAQYALENPEEYRLIFMTDAAYMEQVFAVKTDDDPGQRAFDVVVDAVRAAQAAGHIRPIDPTLVAEMLWTSTHGVVSLAITCKDVLESPLEELSESLHAALLRGLAP